MKCFGIYIRCTFFVWILQNNKKRMDKIVENSEIKIRLQELAEEKYKDFSSSLIPGCTNMIGVRIPHIRLLAKQIVKDDWRSYLKNASEDTFEEIMLQGIVIGYSKCEIDEKLEWAKAFIPKIKNWSINDVFCAGFKIAKDNKEAVFNFLTQYISSEDEYEQRVVAVMLMNYFLTEDYIDRVLMILQGLKHEGYYTKMAVAWAFATAYTKFPENIYLFLSEDNSLDDFTFNKSIQKMIESYRVSKTDKEKLRKLKRKSK